MQQTHTQSVTQFTLDNSCNSLLVVFENGQKLSLRYEYLRVCSQWQPSSDSDKHSNHSAKKVVLPSNHKGVLLKRIESVGEHGFRLCFDDNYHFIATSEQLQHLHSQHNHYWQAYLAELKAQNLTREASIAIKLV
ncbi:DUF971 domain-containing protein [Endozoicomonas sp. G2_1]|uniref:gamma-butyrobetaine hydroxylase-like domain-containing protein n=1 Tax=Endozoicomonas sp. G2_1 TaxID=2821091 RepID=UPI001ADB9219|nr:gamma-butyrobetaine hydroxylase-like domain-containing protein [Endozoicomonas sp. G2_1]MBO9490942.1 DUF971 domain-containing protein [Endozoicomonas sp. G2_1]